MSLDDLLLEDMAEEAFNAAMGKAISLDMPHPVIIVWNGGECICYSTKFPGVFWSVPVLDGFRVKNSVLTTLTAP